MTRAFIGAAGIMLAANLALASQRFPAGEGATSHVAVGTTSVRSKMPDGSPVVVTLRVQKADRAKLVHWDYWGNQSNHEPPRTIVTQLTIAAGGDTVFVPFGAYGDLSEPDELSVSCGGVGATVTIKGADAGESYMASLIVLHGLLYKRRVEAMEFPSEVWEETVYSWIPDADDR